MTAKEKHLLVLEEKLSRSVDYMIDATQDHIMRAIDDDELDDAYRWYDLCGLALELQEHFA